MAARPSSPRKTSRLSSVNVAVALFTPRDGALAVLLVPARAARPKDRWLLPSDMLLADETLDDAAARVARGVLGAPPSLLDQALASTGARVAGDGAQLTVTYFGLAPELGAVPSQDASWVPTTDIGSLAARLTADIDVAINAMRARVDQQPIAFKLLPPTFTLSELQSVYELLLGRRLHKASFRRSLHASSLVEATDEWRSEGRGRPAQLFRYSPPKRRRRRRGIRFDLLG